jgi:hypothetical protein
MTAIEIQKIAENFITENKDPKISEVMSFCKSNTDSTHDRLTLFKQINMYYEVVYMYLT